MVSRTRRPKFLNLLQISLPITGVVSIAHRISGVVLVFAIPLMIYALQLSLASRQSFEQLAQVLDAPAGKVVFVLVVWALMYHLVAGLRFLLLDVHIGINLAAARRNAWLVIAISLSATGFVAGVCL